MNTSILVRLALLLLSILILSGCLLIPVPVGDGPGGHDRGRHEGHRDRH